jgi:hypothetical protein
MKIYTVILVNSGIPETLIVTENGQKAEAVYLEAVRDNGASFDPSNEDDKQFIEENKEDLILIGDLYFSTSTDDCDIVLQTVEKD